MPDAFRAGGGHPVQAGARAQRHHPRDLVGEATGNSLTKHHQDSFDDGLYLIGFKIFENSIYMF